MISSGRSLRVAVLDPNANTPPYDRALCAALARAGCQVELVTAPFLYEALPAPAGHAERHAFFRLGVLSHWLGLDRRPRLRRVLRAAEYPLDWAALLARALLRRPDLVHVQWSLQPTVDCVAWGALRRLGIPIIYTVHNVLPHTGRPGDHASYRRLYHAADGLVVHGERAAAALVEQFGVPRDRLTVVPHGPLLEDEPTTDRAVARRQLGLPESAPLILFAGLIEPYKGLGDLIEAFAQIAAEHQDARLVIAGRPNEPFEPYRRALSAHGLLDRVHLDLRFLETAELAAYLCAADIVALPYRRATTSGMLAAARRFGRPAVVTPDLADSVLDGETGLLVPAAEPRGLAIGLGRLLADPALARRIGARGRQYATSFESWDQLAQRTMALYRAIVESRARPSTQ